jgi:hypothetical protein
VENHRFSAVRHVLGTGRRCSQRTSPKNNARHLGPDKRNGVGAFSFFHSGAEWCRKPQKSRRAAGNLPRSGWASPFENGSVRTKVKDPYHQYLHRRFDNPTTAVQENGTYGGQGKAVGSQRPTALLCELSLFVLAVTSRKINTRSNSPASGYQRPVIVPHTAERRKLRPRPARASGPSFCW